MVWDDKNVSKLQNYNTVFVQKVLDGSNITDLRKKKKMYRHWKCCSQAEMA